MVKTFTLTADKDALRFDIAENGWTRLTLVGQSEVYLGADIFDRVFSRLIGYLTNKDVLGRASAGQIEGHPIYCLLLLSEAHRARRRKYVFLAECECQPDVHRQRHASFVIAAENLG